MVFGELVGRDSVCGDACSLVTLQCTFGNYQRYVYLEGISPQITIMLSIYNMCLHVLRLELVLRLVGTIN